MKRGVWVGLCEVAKAGAEWCREVWFVEVVFDFLPLRNC